MKRALVIIDVQKDYFPGGKSELYKPCEALEKIKYLLRDFREKGERVYFIRHLQEEGGSFFVPGTEGARIHEEIMPLETEEVLVKHYPDSFWDTGLHEKLQQEGITELVLCGMMSYMCVDTTVRAASRLGYENTLVHDACATRDLYWKEEVLPAELVHKVYMASLGDGFANVISCEDYLLHIG